MKVGIIQSNYIPWRGYFDFIDMVDEFILYDDVQFTKNDWRNRNQIKTRKGQQWITIPVKQKNLSQKINETKIARSNWAKKHWNAIKTNYSKAPFFSEYRGVLEDLYRNLDTEYLSIVNYSFIIEICRILGITTKISWSTDYNIEVGQTERLVSLCSQVGATSYLSGPSAKEYLDITKFLDAGITVEFKLYRYEDYPQINGRFIPKVSVLDLIFNCGENSRQYLKCI